jgi:hypothetical protein
MIEFQNIWFQNTEPEASLDAMKARSVGVLSIDESGAKFRSTDLFENIGTIHSVTQGRRGTDFVNRWIEIQYLGNNGIRTAYLKDGNWRGWRPLLTGSNRKIFESLQALCIAREGP